MTVFGHCKSDPDIPIGELDYGFIEKCEDINKLQKILMILRSGEEGRYPELEQFTENQLAKKSPDSPMLEKFNKEIKMQDMPKDELKKTIDELNSMSSIPIVKNSQNGSTESSNLPPIRNSKGTETEHMIKKEPEVVARDSNKPKNPVPQSPEYWEKLNKQVDKEDGGEFENICKETSASTHLNSNSQTKPAHELLTKQKLNANILQEDAIVSAQKEKNKGNEAFRCGDFKEALIYYNRSLDILPTAPSYNNKAITLIKLENFKEALDACEMVINLEPDNIKAHMRRGIANQSLEYLEKAVEDFTKVTELEPTNKRGKELLEKVSKELEKRNVNRKKKGHRIKIEEVNTSLPSTNGEHPGEISDADKQKKTSVEENIQISEVNMNGNDNTSPTIKKCENNVIETETCGKEYKDQEKEKDDIAEKSQPIHINTKNDELDKSIDKSNKELGDCNKERSFVDVNENVVKKVVKELPGSVIEMKDKGNEFYKSGQYDTACEMYTSCINELLENKSAYKESLAILFSNRASCQSRMGNSKQCISDCDRSLKISHSAKVYLKRAKAYESLEKYLNAYADYQSVHKMDSSSVNALQACSRLGSVLRTQYGNTWRDKLPKTDVIPVDRTSFSSNTYMNVDTKEIASVEKEKAAEETPSKTSEVLDDQNSRVCTDNNKRKTCEREAPHMEGDVQKDTSTPPTKDQTCNNTSTPSMKGQQQSDNIPIPPLKDQQASNDTPTSPMKDQQPNNNTKKNKIGINDIKITKEKLEKEQKVLGFFETKEKGNSCVQLGKYEEAIQCYTQCVEFLPKEVPSYTNRALCYLKLKQPEKAIEDCSFALKLKPSCVKALFRRAQARKMLKGYKEALADLTQVLKLEPNNNAAKKEMEQCKSEFHAALRSIQAENEAAKLRDLKGKGKKVPIEEITSESAEFSVKGKMSTKFGKCPLAKENNLRNAQSKKMTGFEFLHAWNNVKSKKTADYAELLMQIDPTKLVDLLSNKLDGEILKNFIHTINEHFTSKDAFRRGVQLLKSLCKASRFVTMLMFLNTTEKAVLRSTIESLESRAKQTSEKALISDINSLRVSYQCS